MVTVARGLLQRSRDCPRVPTQVQVSRGHSHLVQGQDRQLEVRHAVRHQPARLVRPEYSVPGVLYRQPAHGGPVAGVSGEGGLDHAARTATLRQ